MKRYNVCMDTPTLTSTLTRLEYFTYSPRDFRTAREGSGKSIEALAGEMNVHRKTIERIERGENGSYETAVAYCRLVGLNPLIVITPIDNPTGKRRGREASQKNFAKNST